MHPHVMCRRLVVAVGVVVDDAIIDVENMPPVRQPRATGSTRRPSDLPHASVEVAYGLTSPR